MGQLRDTPSLAAILERRWLDIGYNDMAEIYAILPYLLMES